MMLTLLNSYYVHMRWDGVALALVNSLWCAITGLTTANTSTITPKVNVLVRVKFSCALIV
jgi:hypothetical protein